MLKNKGLETGTHEFLHFLFWRIRKWCLYINLHPELKVECGTLSFPKQTCDTEKYRSVSNACFIYLSEMRVMG